MRRTEALAALWTLSTLLLLHAGFGARGLSFSANAGRTARGFRESTRVAGLWLEASERRGAPVRRLAQVNDVQVVGLDRENSTGNESLVYSDVPEDGVPSGTVVVQIEVEVAQVVARDLRLALLLQRQKPDGAWATWSTARERVLQLRDVGMKSPVSQTLADVARRADAKDAADRTVTRSFNQQFRALHSGVYRVAVLDRSTCTPSGTCAVLDYSVPQTLPGENGLMTAQTAMALQYGAIELGLQFTSCANGSSCLVPAHGVLTSVVVTDAEGTVFDPLWQSDSTVRVDAYGYAILGAYLGVERTVQFSTRQTFVSRLRPDLNISATDTSMSRSLGVLNVTDYQLLCAPSPPGQPYHEFLLTDDLNGVIPKVMQNPHRVLYLPGLQCFWIISPRAPVSKIHMQFTQMGRGLGDGSSVKVYSLMANSQGSMPRLIRNVQGLTQDAVEVPGSKALLHFSAEHNSPLDSGFQMLWTAVPEEDDSSWFDTRTATIVFSSLAGAAYTIAAVAAWKWYRQRVDRQHEEARRLAAREAQRNLRRRHRQEGRRSRRTRGLPLELVSRLPTSNIRLAELEKEEGGEEPVCTICLCEYEEGENVTWLPCSHSYHTDCVTSWLKSSLTCPICKDNVKRSLLKTLSMYRELHRGNGAADFEGGGTDVEDEGVTGAASRSTYAGADGAGSTVELSMLRMDVEEGVGTDRSESEGGVGQSSREAEAGSSSVGASGETQDRGSSSSEAVATNPIGAP